MGDVVAEDQTLAEVETDKAVVEMPSPRAGRIAKLHAEEGETIEVGQVIVTIDEEAGAPASAKIGVRVPSGAAPAPAAAPHLGHAGEEEEEVEFYTGSVIGHLEEASDEPCLLYTSPSPRDS